jgi:dTDP-4-amino-4,6-dideoxygalactose transaminase
VGLCPVTERVSDRLVRLPLYFSMTTDDESHVVDAVRRFTSV